jgi:hypothetical protein
MRGMMTAAALGVWELLFFAGPLFSFSRVLSTLAAYVPGAVLAFSFLLWHWQATGWTGYHPAFALGYGISAHRPGRILAEILLAIPAGAGLILAGQEYGSCSECFYGRAEAGGRSSVW